MESTIKFDAYSESEILFEFVNQNFQLESTIEIFDGLEPEVPTKSLLLLLEPPPRATTEVAEPLLAELAVKMLSFSLIDKFQLFIRLLGVYLIENQTYGKV